nr:helix-turn-helix domain-containing protein [uncultured Carboxylicivirga sp.]
MSTLLHIKNMVCPRCIEAVESILTDENLSVEFVELGKVIVKEDLSDELKSKLAKIFKERGFELILKKNEIVIDEIKSIIINLIHHSGEIPEHLNFSEVISQKLNSNYKYLSSLFSSSEGITIEKYVILQKIEKIKELISYDGMTFSEIASYLGYSSVGHMSTQFKNKTGLTPSQYSKLDVKKRSKLDDI